MLTTSAVPVRARTLSEAVGYHRRVDGSDRARGRVLANFTDTAPSEIMIRMRGMLADAGFDADATEAALNPLFFYVAGTLASGFTGFGDVRVTRELRRNFERGLDIILSGIRADLQP